MHRAFHLTNEFRADGPEQLVALLCASPTTVAWGPVFPLLEDAFRSGRIPLSPKGLIRLLEDPRGPLKVMGRPEWLTDPAFRRGYAWELARPWRADFDGEIRRLAIEDLSKPLRDRRVILASPERGWGRAEERLAAPDRIKLLRLVRRLIARGTVPPGIVQRAEDNEARKHRHPAETVLRDIYNHEDAVNESGSALTALDPLYATFVGDLAGAAVRMQFANGASSAGSPTRNELGEVAELLRRLTPVIDESQFLRFLASRDRTAFQSLVHHPRAERLPVDVVRRLVGIAEQPPIVRALIEAAVPDVKSKDPITRMLSGWDVASLITSLLTQNFDVTQLVPMAARVARVPLQRAGLVPLVQRDRDRELACLFYLCYRRQRPTLPQVKRLIALLAECLSDLEPA